MDTSHKTIRALINGWPSIVISKDNLNIKINIFSLYPSSLRYTVSAMALAR